MLESLNLLEPLLVVVITINPRYAETVGMALALILANIVFLSGVDVGVKVKDGGADVVLEHPFDNGGGARGAACMEQHLMKPFGYLYVVLFLHLYLFVLQSYDFFVNNP